MCQAGAIAAGNAVCVKVSELLPATNSLLAELFPKYLDPSLYNIVNGDVPVSTKVRIPTLSSSFALSHVDLRSCWSYPGTTVSRCRYFYRSDYINVLQSFTQASMVTWKSPTLTNTSRFWQSRQNCRSGSRKKLDPRNSRSKWQLWESQCRST